jgi:hypothetical protein
MAQYWEQMSDTSVWKLSLSFLATLKKILREIFPFFFCCLFVFSSIVDAWILRFHLISRFSSQIFLAWKLWKQSLIFFKTQTQTKINIRFVFNFLCEPRTDPELTGPSWSFDLLEWKGRRWGRRSRPGRAGAGRAGDGRALAGPHGGRRQPSPQRAGVSLARVAGGASQALPSFKVSPSPPLQLFNLIKLIKLVN